MSTERQTTKRPNQTNLKTPKYCKIPGIPEIPLSCNSGLGRNLGDVAQGAVDDEVSDSVTLILKKEEEEKRRGKRLAPSLNHAIVVLPRSVCRDKYIYTE